MILPLCSIVIPAYNAEVWIVRTLQSAAQQDYPNLEILVIDDGSNDGTRKLVESFSEKNERFRLISLRNGGVANARNVGIREARGKYVAFLDADDLWHPTKISHQVAAMQAPLNGVLPAASYVLAREIDAHDRVLSNRTALGESGYILTRNMYFKFSGNGSSILVLRDVALEVGGYDPSWIKQGTGGCEDIDFELAVAARYPIICVQQLLVGYRKAPGTMSTRRRDMARGALGVMEKHLKANAEIPTWAKHLVYSSVLSYTLPRLLEGRHWPDVAKHLTILSIHQPTQAVNILLETIKRRSTRMVRQLFEKSQPAEATTGPLFGDVKPNMEPDQIRIRHPRERQILTRLAELDAKLWNDFRKSNRPRSLDAEDKPKGNAASFLERE